MTKKGVTEYILGGFSVACSVQAEKIEKEIQNIGETVKAVQKSACAEEKKAETTQNLKEERF